MPKSYSIAESRAITKLPPPDGDHARPGGPPYLRGVDYQELTRLLAEKKRALLKCKTEEDIQPHVEDLGRILEEIGRIDRAEKDRARSFELIQGGKR